MASHQSDVNIELPANLIVNLCNSEPLVRALLV